MRLRPVGIDSLQALAKQGLLKDTTICNLKFGEHCVLDMKTKVKFDTTIYHSGGLLDWIHIDVWSLINTASLIGHRYFISFVDGLSMIRWEYPMRQRLKVLNLFVKLKKLMEKQEE